MDELALGVVANSAGVERKCSVAQQGSGNTGNAQVNRFGFNMLGVFGGVRCSAGSEFVVGFLGAVAGEYVDHGVWPAEFGKHGVQYIEGARVVGVDFFVVRVSQKLIQLVERFGNVRIADAVDDIDHVAGVAVLKLNLIFFAFFRQGIFMVGKKSDDGKSHVQEGVRQGVKLGARVGNRFAGMSCGYDDTGESHKARYRCDCYAAR